MQTSISHAITTLAYCRGQELSVGVLCECKRSAVVAQLTITMVPYGTERTALKSAPSHREISTPFYYGSLGPPKSSNIDRFSRFFTSQQTAPILYNKPPHFPLKIASSPRGSAPPIHSSLGPPEWASQFLNGISTGSDAFAGLKNMTNLEIYRQTDRLTDWPRYSVYSNRPLPVAIVAMRPLPPHFCISYCLANIETDNFILRYWHLH